MESEGDFFTGFHSLIDLKELYKNTCIEGFLILFFGKNLPEKHRVSKKDAEI